jgi:hypothetical protein
MKNKRGDSTLLMNETFKIIIAAICIIFLLILSAKLYFIFVSKTKIEQAKATLELIEGKIEAVKETGIPATIVINSPKDYFLYFELPTKSLCFAPPYVFVEHPVAKAKDILPGVNLDKRKAVCNILEDKIVISNRAFLQINDKIQVDKSIAIVILKGDNSIIISVNPS